MKRGDIICYLSYFPEKELDLSLKTAKSLTPFYKVVYLYVYDYSVSFRQVQKNPTLILKFIRNVYYLLAKNFVSWQFYEFIPLRRFKLIRKLNEDLNVFLFKLFSLNKRVVLITNTGNIEAQKLIKKINPYIAIGERVDIWEDSWFRNVGVLLDCFVSNSKKIHYGQKKDFSKRVYFSEKGYVSRKVLIRLHRRKYRNKDKKTILYLGNIDWKMNFELTHLLTNKLIKYDFLFVGSLLRGYKKPLSKLNKKAQKEWEKISKKPNVQLVEVDNEDDFPGLSFQANIGIIPFEVGHIHCKYGGFPIKLNYYLAMGLPVVSTEILSILPLQSEFLKFAKNERDFLFIVKKMINQNVSSKKREKMFALAIKNTYQEKALFFKKVIGKEINLKKSKNNEV